MLSYNSDDHDPDPYNLGSFTGIKEVGGQRANIKLVFGTTVGVAENNAITLSVYPNPAKDLLFVECAEGETVSVYDATGRLVMRETYTGQLDVASLESGVYAVATAQGVARFLKR